MPIATPEVYQAMLKRAKERKFAYPAVNVTSSSTITAALQGFADAKSDGILQVSVGGAEYASGATIKDRVAGTLALAAYAKEVAKNYPVNIALHTDHCVEKNLESWVIPLLKLEAEQVARGEDPTFVSHMFDGSDIPLEHNLEVAKELLDLSKKANTVLEIEVGVVGGEEDGHVAEINEKLYTTAEDGIDTVEALGLPEEDGKVRYLTALTFGNVHGVYKPGAVKLRPAILKDIQDAVGDKFHNKDPFYLVFHGGSGSTPEEISEAVDNGVVKMNIDTDTQYAYTRPVVDHMFKNYDGVIKADGEVGNKKAYDPRAWGKAAEAGMADRIKEAAEQLRSAGQTMGV